ncbi:transporter substrate-binding domain-containing protein [Cyanobacterium sp. Dongsha4]|uniref:transporter substrate-binding domain-containing protein n=1 Tax=Cyanobacterium sp. DS4 TaxID=2878255 RepID=UPI002E80DCD9|nr:transporter substrate-binding domain-containing protein [Cyanobacterium sp. Dongsha4]WVL01875.1 transporter substrate-binding domain-containing protein [Cyanobacterium sp. Dongsha4]
MSIKLSKLLLSFSLFCWFGGGYLTPSVARGETVLEEINRTGVLKVGVRNDAIPFGYRDNGRLEGLCLSLVQLIREEIIRREQRNIISINLLVSGLYNRFDIVQDKVVYLECGPNSIRSLPEYDQVTFSEPFFISGVQLITRRDRISSILNSDGKDLTIGVLAYTNTENLIKEKYPLAQLELFQGAKGNLRGIQSVNQERIDAFANDGILLLGEAILNRIPIEDNSSLSIVPEIPLTCERYGLILSKDENWENLVNSVLQSEDFRRIRRDWFISLAKESLIPRQQCVEN